jgi:propionyl-CoA synthetase
MSRLAETHRRSLEEREAFWREAAAAIDWDRPPDRILDDSGAPFYRWFPDAELNTCRNAVDRHVEGGRAEQPALVYDSPVTGSKRVYTYAELQAEVARLAGALRGLGVEKGDTVVIYMPMVPEAVFAMLACARLGAVHSVVFGGFAPHELAIRIDDARPKAILSASCGFEPGRIVEYKPLLDRAVELATHEARCVVLQREQAEARLDPRRDVDWSELVGDAEPAGCVPVAATEPLYVLYTSGTTAVPKGVIRDNGGHAVALRYSMDAIYDTHPGEVYWAASDVGWVVGHSYIVYAPLLTGCTTILYEGKPVGTPDPGAFWRVIAEHGVKTLFTAPTALRAIKKEDPSGTHLREHDLARFRYLFLAGERLDPDTYHWAADLLDVPVVDHWWQTETGWPIAANCLGIDELPAKPGSATRPVPGYEVHVFDEAGQDCGPNEDGAIAIRLPLPPGTLPTLWGADDRFVESYLSTYPDCYLTGDGGFFDEDGYLFVMGRIDDVINVAGHRISAGAIEEVVANHPDVAECAVIGAQDELRGQVPVALVVLKAGSAAAAGEVERRLVEMVRAEVGAFAYFRRALVVDRLPKTRSGKILRSTIRKIAAHEEYAVPSTIDDPAALEEIEAALGIPSAARSVSATRRR